MSVANGNAGASQDRLRELDAELADLDRRYTAKLRAADRARRAVDFNRHYDEADRLQARILVATSELRRLRGADRRAA